MVTVSKILIYRATQLILELYLTATGIEEKTEKVQVATFLHVAGPDAQCVYNTFDIVADDREKIDVLKTKFKEYCEPRKNLSYIRHVFFTRNQGQKVLTVMT
jgi:hypothetical protein